jgi:hypothetical protein
MADVDDIMDVIEWEEEEDRLYEWAMEDTEDNDIDIGVCWCGQYGEAGKIHNRLTDYGKMEECGEYL